MGKDDFGGTVKFYLCVNVTFLLCELVQQATLANSLQLKRIKHKTWAMLNEHEQKPEPERAQENNQAAFVQKYYHVSYDDVFEYVAVVVRARRHFHCLRPTLHRKCFVNLFSFFLK